MCLGPALAALAAFVATAAWVGPAAAADGKLRIITFGAHPDDCELDTAGVAAKWAALGHKVKCVSVTNGDIVVAIDDVVDKKLAVVEAMESQFYEGGCCDVPAGGMPTDAAGKEARRKQVHDFFASHFAATADRFRPRLAEWYGTDRAAGIKYAEAFEICEYGRQPTQEEIRQLFPFLPSR